MAPRKKKAVKQDPKQLKFEFIPNGQVALQKPAQPVAQLAVALPTNEKPPSFRKLPTKQSTLLEGGSISKVGPLTQLFMRSGFLKLSRNLNRGFTNNETSPESGRRRSYRGQLMNEIYESKNHVEGTFPQHTFQESATKGHIYVDEAHFGKFLYSTLNKFAEGLLYKSSHRKLHIHEQGKIALALDCDGITLEEAYSQLKAQCKRNKDKKDVVNAILALDIIYLYQTKKKPGQIQAVDVKKELRQLLESDYNYEIDMEFLARRTPSNSTGNNAVPPTPIMLSEAGSRSPIPPPNFDLADDESKDSIMSDQAAALPLQSQNFPEALTLNTMPADGHCLFRSVGYHLEHGDPTVLRQFVANYLENHREEFTDFHIGNKAEFQAYVRGIRRNAACWGDALCIEALQRLTGRPIIIFRADAEPTIPDNMQNYAGQEPIFIHYINGNHYNTFTHDSTQTCLEILAEIQARLTNGERVRFVPSVSVRQSNNQQNQNASQRGSQQFAAVLGAVHDGALASSTTDRGNLQERTALPNGSPSKRARKMLEPAVAIGQEEDKASEQAKDDTSGPSKRNNFSM